jgi:tRNA-dihydrouridine synthase B
MIGRAAQGRPWIFREIAHYLRHGRRADPPPLAEIRAVLRAHLLELHDFYGEAAGLRIARKHVSWYTSGLAGGAAFRHAFNKLESAQAQLHALEAYFDQLGHAAEPYTSDAREELAA